MPEYNFNPGAHNPRFGGGDSLGVGKHPVVGTSVELKNANSGQGGYLALTVTAIDGPEKGGTKTIRFNLHHSNPETVRIAESQLAATCVVMGITGPWGNTDILKDKPFVINIVPQPGSDKYTEVNEVFALDGRSVSDCMKNPPQAQGGAPAGFGGGASTGAPSGGGGWGGAAAAQETKTEPAASGGGWGAAASGGGAQGGAAAGGWQQNAGGGASTGSGWGSAA